MLYQVYTDTIPLFPSNGSTTHRTWMLLKRGPRSASRNLGRFSTRFTLEQWIQARLRWLSDGQHSSDTEHKTARSGMNGARRVREGSSPLTRTTSPKPKAVSARVKGRADINLSVRARQSFANHIAVYTYLQIFRLFEAMKYLRA